MLTIDQIKASEKFCMPRVCVSEWVEWFPSINDIYGSPEPAFVAKVNERNITLKVFPQGTNSIKTYTGVRHVDDPVAQDMSVHADGVWRKQSHVRTLDQAESRIKSLEESVALLAERQGVIDDALDQLREEIEKRFDKIDG